MHPWVRTTSNYSDGKVLKVFICVQLTAPWQRDATCTLFSVSVAIRDTISTASHAKCNTKVIQILLKTSVTHNFLK